MSEASPSPTRMRAESGTTAHGAVSSYLAATASSKELGTRKTSDLKASQLNDYQQRTAQRTPVAQARELLEAKRREDEKAAPRSGAQNKAAEGAVESKATPANPRHSRFRSQPAIGAATQAAALANGSMPPMNLSGMPPRRFDSGSEMPSPVGSVETLTSPYHASGGDGGGSGGGAADTASVGSAGEAAAGAVMTQEPALQKKGSVREKKTMFEKKTSSSAMEGGATQGSRGFQRHESAGLQDFKTVTKNRSEGNVLLGASMFKGTSKQETQEAAILRRRKEELKYSEETQRAKKMMMQHVQTDDRFAEFVREENLVTVEKKERCLRLWVAGRRQRGEEVSQEAARGFLRDISTTRSYSKNSAEWEAALSKALKEVKADVAYKPRDRSSLDQISAAAAVAATSPMRRARAANAARPSAMAASAAAAAAAEAAQPAAVSERPASDAEGLREAVEEEGESTPTAGAKETDMPQPNAPSPGAEAAPAAETAVAPLEDVAEATEVEELGASSPDTAETGDDASRASMDRWEAEATIAASDDTDSAVNSPAPHSAPPLRPGHSVALNMAPPPTWPGPALGLASSGATPVFGSPPGTNGGSPGPTFAAEEEKDVAVADAEAEPASEAEVAAEKEDAAASEESLAGAAAAEDSATVEASAAEEEEETAAAPMAIVAEDELIQQEAAAAAAAVAAEAEAAAAAAAAKAAAEEAAAAAEAEAAAEAAAEAERQAWAEAAEAREREAAAKAATEAEEAAAAALAAAQAAALAEEQERQQREEDEAAAAAAAVATAAAEQARQEQLQETERAAAELAAAEAEAATAVAQQEAAAAEAEAAGAEAAANASSVADERDNADIVKADEEVGAGEILEVTAEEAAAEDDPYRDIDAEHDARNGFFHGCKCWCLWCTFKPDHAKSAAKRSAAAGEEREPLVSATTPAPASYASLSISENGIVEAKEASD